MKRAAICVAEERPMAAVTGTTGRNSAFQANQRGESCGVYYVSVSHLRVLQDALRYFTLTMRLLEYDKTSELATQCAQ
jgi:hypothetical protein